MTSQQFLIEVFLFFPCSLALPTFILIFLYKVLCILLIPWPYIHLPLQESIPSPSCLCVLSCFSHVQHCATLWTVAQQTLSMRFFSKQEHWSGFPYPPSGDLPDPRFELEPYIFSVGSQVLHQWHHLGSPSVHPSRHKLSPHFPVKLSSCSIQWWFLHSSSFLVFKLESTVSNFLVIVWLLFILPLKVLLSLWGQRQSCTRPVHFCESLK